jgi:predicted TIM-barrel fold metal-dependent hydrolase
MNIIDMHAHIAAADLLHKHFLTGLKEVLTARAAQEYGVELQPNLIDRLTAHRLSDPDCVQLLAEMDAAKISKTVLLIADFGFGHADDELALPKLYEQYHKVLQANPERFIVFGGSDPRRGVPGLDLFEHGLRDLGFRGLKLYPPCGYESDDISLFPYYELCEAYGVPVLLHTGPSLSSMNGDRRYPSSILKAAERFARVNFILGHAAFQNFETNLSLALTRRNVVLETSGFQRRLDHEDEIRERLRVLFDRVPDQVVFGTDWPVFNIRQTQRDWVDYFLNLRVLDESQTVRLFYANAVTALGSV